jgi:hypothetical protein
VEEQQRGRVVGPPLRHHEDVVDQAHRVDDRVHQHEERGGHEQREDHAAEVVRARGALDARGLGERGRDRLQRREVEDHEEAGFLPDRHDGHAGERVSGIAQPVAARDAEGPQHLL